MERTLLSVIEFFMCQETCWCREEKPIVGTRRRKWASIWRAFSMIFLLYSLSQHSLKFCTKWESKFNCCIGFCVCVCVFLLQVVHLVCKWAQRNLFGQNFRKSFFGAVLKFCTMVLVFGRKTVWDTDFLGQTLFVAFILQFHSEQKAYWMFTRICCHNRSGFPLFDDKLSKKVFVLWNTY